MDQEIHEESVLDKVGVPKYGSASKRRYIVSRLGFVTLEFRSAIRVSRERGFNVRERTLPS